MGAGSFYQGVPAETLYYALCYFSRELSAVSLELCRCDLGSEAERALQLALDELTRAINFYEERLCK